jgi:hypothetical protein
MSLREHERRTRQRRHNHAQLNTAPESDEDRARQRRERANQLQRLRRKPATETEAQRAQRLREQRERRALQRQHAAQSGALVVYPFDEWCVMRSLSKPQGRRVIAEGRVKVTWLSERRMGIRSDHDLEYLNAGLREGA